MDAVSLDAVARAGGDEDAGTAVEGDEVAGLPADGVVAGAKFTQDAVTAIGKHCGAGSIGPNEVALDKVVVRWADLVAKQELLPRLNIALGRLAQQLLGVGCGCDHGASLLLPTRKPAENLTSILA